MNASTKNAKPNLAVKPVSGRYVKPSMLYNKA